MGKTIMVVDDTADIVELMKIVLTTHGFTPKTYTNPREALTALKNDQLPDLLILDMRMPELSGTDVCEELRKDPKFDKLPIAFFTASSELDKTLLTKYRVKGFLFKPFSIDKLVEQINAYLSSQ